MLYNEYIHIWESKEILANMSNSINLINITMQKEKDCVCSALRIYFH